MRFIEGWRGQRRIRELEERTIKVTQFQQQREESLKKKDRASAVGL